MTNLVIHLKAPLKNPNHHVCYQTNTMLNRDRFGPCWRALLGITKASHNHVVESIICKLAAFVINNLARADTLSPGLIFNQAIQQAVLIPAEMCLLRGSHLDPSPDHAIYNLSRGLETVQPPPPS